MNSIQGKKFKKFTEQEMGTLYLTDFLINIFKDW